jgi:hypothetical protein
MAHIHNQNLEAHFNTLHSNFTETQQEMRQISANIVSINQKMHSSIGASITTSIMKLKQDLKQDMTTHLESVTTMICTKLHILADLPLSDPPFHTKGETSSHSQNFQPHHFHRDLHLSRVDVTKFHGLDPIGWVTQMEHYFSLCGIMDELAKHWHGVLHIDQECWQWWKWRKNPAKGMYLGHTLW